MSAESNGGRKPSPHGSLQRPEGYIANVWVLEGGPWYRLELPHNSPAVDPSSTCRGTVSVKIRPGQTGIAAPPCQDCGLPVEVDLATLRNEFNIT